MQKQHTKNAQPRKNIAQTCLQRLHVFPSLIIGAISILSSGRHTLYVGVFQAFTHNKIVVDHTNGSSIRKKCNYLATLADVYTAD